MSIAFFLALSVLFWTAIPQQGVPPPPPSSQEWRYLTTDTRGKAYYYIPKSKSYYSEVWFKTDDEFTKEIAVSLSRFNCETGANRLIQVNTFRGNELVNTFVYNDSEWGYAEPKTIGASELRAACGERKREWTYIGSSTDHQFHFLKLDSLSRTGKFVRVWSQASEGENRKAVTLNEFDCAENKIRTIQSTSYVGSEVTTSTRPSAWSYVIPNSIGEIMARSACQFRRATPTKKTSNK